MGIFTTLLGAIGFFVTVMVALGLAALVVVIVVSAVIKCANAIYDWFEI